MVHDMEIAHPPQELAVPEWVGIIDADAAVRDSLSALISLEGILARPFATGRQFLRELTNDHAGLRCVLCDADLPDTGGLALFELVRSRGVAAPFALMVSRVPEAMRQAANTLGVDAVLTKPIVDPTPLLSFARASQARA